LAQVAGAVVRVKQMLEHAAWQLEPFVSAGKALSSSAAFSLETRQTVLAIWNRHGTSQTHWGNADSLGPWLTQEQLLAIHSSAAWAREWLQLNLHGLLPAFERACCCGSGGPGPSYDDAAAALLSARMLLEQVVHRRGGGELLCGGSMAGLIHGDGELGIYRKLMLLRCWKALSNMLKPWKPGALRPDSGPSDREQVCRQVEDVKAWLVAHALPLLAPGGEAALLATSVGWRRDAACSLLLYALSVAPEVHRVDAMSRVDLVDCAQGVAEQLGVAGCSRANLEDAVGVLVESKLAEVCTCGDGLQYVSLAVEEWELQRCACRLQEFSAWALLPSLAWHEQQPAPAACWFL
jgi:hypothetical protein